MSDFVPERDGYHFERHGGDSATLRFVANEGHVATALKDLADHLRGRGCPPGLVDDGTIVMAEVLNNVEEHAYAGAAGPPITILLEVVDESLRCVVEDRGRRYPEDKLPVTDMPSGSLTSLDTLPEGGFGWPLVRKLTSDVTYVRDGDTNRLVFCVSARTVNRA